MTTATSDPTHPIPDLDAIDVLGLRNDGGADLVIVIATPLQNDERSQTRLLDKLEAYLRYIRSSKFIEEAGTPPNPQNTTIRVQLHRHSAPAIRSLLQRCHAWVNENGATLEVQDLE